MVYKIVSLMASKSKQNNGSDLNKNKTQDKGKKEVQTSENRTESNKDKKLKCSKNDKHGSKEENKHEKMTCESIKMLKEKVTVERKKEKWEKQETQKDYCNNENINEDPVKQSDLIVDEKFKEQTHKEHSVTCNKVKELSVGKSSKEHSEQEILKGWNLVVTGHEKGSHLPTKSSSGELKKTVPKHKHHEGQFISQSAVDGPSSITTQTQQNKVLQPDLASTRNTYKTYNKFGSSSSDKKDISRPSTDLDKSRSNVLSPKEKKSIDARIKSKENKGCHESVHLDNGQLQRSRLPPNDSPDSVQMSASVIERRHSGVKETDTVNCRKRHGSESSPAVIKGTMNRPSDNVFIPLGKPSEKKRKLTPTNSTPEPADLAGNKTGEVTKLLKEKETNPFSEVKTNSGEVGFHTAPDNVTEEKTTHGPMKCLFSKNKKRISHFNSVNITEDPKSQVQVIKTKIMNRSQPKTSASKPQKHPFKQFPINRAPTQESKQVKAEQQIQRNVLEKESKHTKFESRGDIEKTKGKGDGKMKLSKTNNHRSKHEKSHHESKKGEKLGKRQNLKESLSSVSESKKPKKEEIKREGPNKDKDHLEVTTNYFKKLNERIESKSLSDTARKNRLDNENQDVNVEKYDIHAHEDGRTIADTNMTNFVGIKSTVSVTAPLKFVVEDKKQDLAEIEIDKHLSKEKTDTGTEKTKLVDINYSTSKGAAFEATDKQDNNEIKVQNSLNDKKGDKEIPSQNALKDMKTVKKISRENAPKNEKTDKELDLQNAANISNCGKEMEIQNVLKDEKTEREIETEETETNKKIDKETEPEDASKNDKTDEKLKPQDISNDDKSSKETGVQNASKYDEITNVELEEKCEKSEKDFIIEEKDFDQKTHGDSKTDCESDIDMDDIEPIEMIGSVFMNDVNMDEPAENIWNNRIDFESNETDFKVDYCDDSVVFQKKNPNEVSENFDEVDNAVENDTEDEDISREKVGENDSNRREDNTSGQTEKECDEFIEKSFEGNKIIDSTFKSPDRPTKNTPRKRFAPKLETLGKLIEEEKEKENEELKNIGGTKTKSSMQYFKKKSNTESECSDDDDDTELLASGVEVSNGVELPESVTAGTSITTRTEWLKKAKSNLKVPTRLTKPKTQIQPDHRDTNIDIIPDMPQSCETFSKKVFDKGFVLTHKKWLLNGDFEQTYAHLFPNKLYKTTSQGKEKNLGKCLQCQSCSMFFTPLNFTVHHDTNSVVEQIDTDRSKLERYCLHEKGDNDTYKILRDFLMYFNNERSKRYDASPVKLPRTTTPTVEESGQHEEEDLPSARAILQQDTYYPISEDTIPAKSGMSPTTQRSNRSVTQTSFESENTTVQTSAKLEKITVRTSSKPEKSTIQMSIEPKKTTVQTSSKPENIALPTSFTPEDASVQTSAESENTTVQTLTRPENTSVDAVNGQSDNRSSSRYPVENALKNLSQLTRQLNGTRKSKNQFAYTNSSCMYAQTKTTVSTAKMPSRENHERHRVQSSMTNISIPSTQPYTNQNGHVTSAQQFQSLNRSQMSNAHVAQQNSTQQIQMTPSPNNQHHQQNQYFQPVNQKQTCTSVEQQNSVQQLQTQMIQTPTAQRRQSFTKQGMHLTTQQLQPKVTKSTGRKAIQQGQTGLTNDMQQTRAYQHSLNYNYQENQLHGSGQGNHSANNPPVSIMNDTSFTGNVPISSQNVSNVPMFNSLTAPLMDQNVPVARNQGQAHTGFQTKSLVNRNDYTGIPFAVTRSQGIPVVLPDFVQTSQQSANAGNVTTQNENYTMALAQIEMPGVQEPVRPNLSTQSMEAASRHETSPSRPFISISDTARQLMKEAVIEEKRRQLYRELCDLDNINTGDIGLDIMLHAEKSYLRGMTLIDKDILRLTEKSCDTILKQQQQLPASQHGRARQSMEERTNYLGQLKRYPQ